MEVVKLVRVGTQRYLNQKSGRQYITDWNFEKDCFEVIEVKVTKKVRDSKLGKITGLKPIKIVATGLPRPLFELLKKLPELIASYEKSG